MATYPGIALNSPPMLLPAGTVPSRIAPSVLSLYLGFLGDYTTGQPTGDQAALPQNTLQACCFSEWYSSFIYGRVWVIPDSIDYGILAQDSSVEVEVWNAHFAPITLTQIVETDTEGLTLTEPVLTPYAFAQNSSQLYTVTASLAGPAQINARFLFDFASESAALAIVGIRVTPWPFRPNWRDPVLERLAWKTDVIPHVDGSEQRRAQRRIPRRAMEFRVTVLGEECQLLDTLLTGWQSRLFLLPVWMEDVGTTSGAAAGALIVEVEDTTDLGFVDGGLALAKTPAGYIVLELQSVAAQQLTLSNPLARDLSRGAKIYPARMARIAASQTIPKITALSRDALVSFDIQELYEETATDSATSYRSLPVMEELSNWREPLDSQFDRNMIVLDTESGLRDYTDISGVPFLSKAHRWTKGSRADGLALRQWLHARAGRRVPVWVPTGTPDLTPVDKLFIGNPTMAIRNIFYHRYLAGVPGRRHVQIALKDGTKYYREIVSAAAVSSDVENLELDTGLDRTVDPSEIRRISYLQLCRLDSDVIEIAWHTSRVLEVAASFRGLTDDL